MQVHLSEDEVKQSATNLLQNSTELFYTDAPHAKIFKKEDVANMAITHLLKNHLGRVLGLPDIGQLAALGSEKWMRSKSNIE